MNEQQTLLWIKQNLGPIIQEAVRAAKIKNPDLIYTEDWLAGIAMRESGGKIAKLLAGTTVPSGKQLAIIAPLIKGDYTQRKGDVAVVPHGFGFTQIDIASFPAFVKSGDWQDPLKCFKMSIAILEDDRKYLEEHFPELTGDALDRAITASYNCGIGNVRDVLSEGHNIDVRTTDKNYSADVWRLRGIYKTL